MRRKIQIQKQVNDKTFEEGYKVFLNYCKVRNLRDATIKHYINIANYVTYKKISPETIINVRSKK